MKKFLLLSAFLCLLNAGTLFAQESPKKFDKAKFTIHGNNRDVKQSFKDNRHKKAEHKSDHFKHQLKEHRKKEVKQKAKKV